LIVFYGLENSIKHALIAVFQTAQADETDEAAAKQSPNWGFRHRGKGKSAGGTQGKITQI
jgi:hypothetical protein